MTCPNCGEGIEAGQRFCPSCGQRLAAMCAGCSVELPDGARFCPACGTATAETFARPSPPASIPTVERRRVSILFVDLVGFTALAARLDPEEVRDFQARYFDRAREIVERYGGTVEKFVGDAVMAVWGAPRSNEDDPERAVRAGLDLIAAVPGLDMPAGAAAASARAGVATGDVAVTIGAAGQGLVSGDTVNLAARLQAAADAGTVLVDGPTTETANAAIAFEPAGARALKGIDQPVVAWRAERIVAGRGGTGRTEELEAPFVGRSAELVLLKELFHATARERRLRVVSVTGQAGIGKSRLAWEFEKYSDAIEGDVYWHQGRSPAYGEGITFWALGEMVRRRAEIREGDDDEITLAKLREMLAAHVEDATERADIEPALGALLGIDRHDLTERGELFGAWRLLFERLADALPVVLVFEDLQWADGGLVEFIGHLLEWSRRQPIFIVTLARPELTERFPTWGAGQRNFTSIHLEPLPDEDMRVLLGGLVPGLPAGTIKAILRRAEGVPLYAVETVRMLVADGRVVRDGETFRVAAPVDEVTVPRSLHGLVAARLDGLEPADRAVLQQASILGTTFSVEGLSAVTGQSMDQLRPALDRLIARDVIRLETDPRSPERGQYWFVQAVVREVAYETLSKRERKVRHLAAARYFESRGDEELAGALARHYVDAWRAAGEGPEADVLAAQARVALRGAADRAVDLHSYAQALAFLELALEVTADPADRGATLERASSAAWQAARVPDAERLIRAAIDAHVQAGDAVGAARARLALGHLYNSSGRPDDSVEILTAGSRALRDAHPGEERLACGFDAELARAHFLRQEIDPALELADQALAVAERLDAVDVLVDSLVTKGGALMLRRPRESQALVYGAVTLADRYGLTRTGLRARHNLASQVELEDPRAAQALIAESIATTERLGLRAEALWAGSVQDFRLITSGATEEAKARLDETLEDETIPDTVRYFGLVNRIDIAALEGDVALGWQLHAEATAIAAGITNDEYLSALIWIGSWLAMVSGDLQRSAAELTALSRSSVLIDPIGRSVFGRVLVRVGRLSEARAQLELLRQAPEHGRVVDAARIGLEAAIGAAEGSPDAAGRFVESIRMWHELGRRYDESLTQLDFVHLVGTANPAARVAAEELRETCRAKGWNGVLALLESGAPADPSRPATAVAPGEGVVPSGA